MTQQARYKMVCPYCGSEDVSKDATVRWDIDEQRWGVSGIFDNAHCDGCDTELKQISQVEIALEQAVMAPFSVDNLATLEEDCGLPGAALDDKYNPEGDGEHPVISRGTWRDAVAQQETISGYWDWTAHRVAEALAPQP
jgi:hypothetical protein